MENEMLDGVIYKIEICNEFYIGSTIQKLYKRLNKHISNLKDINKNAKLYKTCRINGITNITLIELEKIKVNNKLELNIIEQKYINELKPTLNSKRAYRTEEESRSRHKEYKNKNKEKMKEITKRGNDKKKIKINCEFCGKEMTTGNLSRHKKICN